MPPGTSPRGMLDDGDQTKITDDMFPINGRRRIPFLAALSEDGSRVRDQIRNSCKPGRQFLPHAL